MKRNKSGHPLGTPIDIMREDIAEDTAQWLERCLVEAKEKNGAGPYMGKWVCMPWMCAGLEVCPFDGNELENTGRHSHDAWFDGRTGKLVKVSDWALPQPEEPRG